MITFLDSRIRVSFDLVPINVEPKRHSITCEHFSPSLSIVSFPHKNDAWINHSIDDRWERQSAHFSKATFGRQSFSQSYFGDALILCRFTLITRSIRLFVLWRHLKTETQTQWQLGTICKMKWLCATNDATKNIDWPPFAVDAKTKSSGRVKKWIPCCGSKCMYILL